MKQSRAFERHEHPGVARLQCATEAGEDACDQSGQQTGRRAVERCGEQHEVGQHGGNKQMLPLAQIGGRHDQQHEPHDGEDWQPVGE